ncbi:MAG TPA: hypothetical protein VGO91_00655 [Pyrinomonadaceae bacterium]|nr:hypothetical protein [Pyrinomonadaceae bacterium]
MADDKRREDGQDERGFMSKTREAESSGDPGRTPGSAEGDRETVEEDLKEKENQGEP